MIIKGIKIAIVQYESNLRISSEYLILYLYHSVLGAPINSIHEIRPKQDG